MTLREALTEWSAPPITETESPATDDVLETLIAARKLIAKRKNWTKNSIHSIHRTLFVNWVISERHSYCLLGAVMNSYVRGSRADAIKLVQETIWSLHRKESVERFNDWPFTTHSDVLAVLDHTIDARKAATV